MLSLRRFAPLLVTSALSATLAAGTVTVTTAAAPTATAADLPFTVPQLREPVTGQTTGAAPKQYPGAPVPQPFTTDYLVGFQSDISSYDYGVYWEVVRLYDYIKAQRADIRQDNLNRAIAINNDAAKDPALIRASQIDASADTEGVMNAVSEALGARFGEAFRAALADHRLPKTEYLLGNGYAARAGGLASSTFPEKYYFDEARPYEAAPQAIRRYNDGVHNFYLSSPSFPSGHTNQAAWVTTLLAYMLPEVGPQLIYRGGQAGKHRVVLGVHSPLDVIGGRMTGQAAAADRLNDPRMRDALNQAAAEIRAEIEWRTGMSIAQLVATDTPYVTTQQAVDGYTPLLSYGFAPVYHAAAAMVVPQAAPVLLSAAHPELNWEQRAELLRLTAEPAGNPLDWQGPGGSWQRLNLARAMAAQVIVNADGSLTLR